MIAVLALSINGNGIAAPRWHFDLDDRLHTLLSQFLDDPRWIAMLAAVLTVSGPWLPARWRRWWWALLLAFVPIHLVVSAVVPARSLLGLAVGWFVGALTVLVVGTPALEVPLDGAVRALVRRGFAVTGLTVVRPAGPGPLVLSAACGGRRPTTPRAAPSSRCTARISAAAASCARSGDWLRLRNSETAPLQTSMRRAVEHRGADGDRRSATSAWPTRTTMALAALDRGWTLYAHTPPRGVALDETSADDALVAAGVEGARQSCTSTRSPTATCAAKEITIDDGTALFGGFGNAEYGATDAQLQADIAALLVTTTAIFGAEAAVARGDRRRSTRTPS